MPDVLLGQVSVCKLAFRLGICSETKLTDGALCFRWMTVACPPVGSLVVPIAAFIRALVRAAVNKSGPAAPRAPYVCFCHFAASRGVCFCQGGRYSRAFCGRMCERGDKVQKQLHPGAVFGTAQFQRLVDHVDIAVGANQQTILFQLGTSSRRHEERHSNIWTKKKGEHLVQMSLASDPEQGLAARA